MQHSADSLARPPIEPSNAVPDSSRQLVVASGPLKRKANVLGGGSAEEIVISEHTFRAKHRAVERGSAQREALTGRQIKEQARRLRAQREDRGNALIADGDGAYVGPWARRKLPEFEEVAVDDLAQLESDDEFEIVEEGDEGGEDDDADVVASGTVVQAPAKALERRQEIEAMGSETTTFYGESEHDYLGRTYMHVPLDLDVNLRKAAGSVPNFIPKKLLHAYRHHAGPVTALRLFPRFSHLGLSGSSDCTVKIFDMYHGRELLRTFTGHAKAITDLSFNTDGTRFVSAAFDRQMKLWDTETGQCVNRFGAGKTPNVVVFGTAAEHAHEFLAGLSDNRIVQYDTRASGKAAVVQEYDHHLGAINTLELVDEGRRIMSTSDDRSLRVWEYGIPVEIKTVSEPDMFALTRSARHPSGKYVLYQADNQILAYSAADKFRQNRKKCWRGHNSAGSGIGLACSPDGQFVASGDTAGYVCFWDFKSCKMYHKLQADKDGGAVNCVVWSEQETSKVLTAGTKGEIKLWD